MVQQSSSGFAPGLRDLCDHIMNMDSRIRFAGILDGNGKLVERGMRKNVIPLLSEGKDDLFYLRTVSRIKELKDLQGSLGDLAYIIKMEKIAFVSMSLQESDKTLLVSMEPDADPSFVIPIIKNALVE
jgi:hypothetical protein